LSENGVPHSTQIQALSGDTLREVSGAYMGGGAKRRLPPKRSKH